MKQLSIIACLLLMLTPAQGAEPLTAQDQQILLALKEVQAQQAAIAANHAKIEEKLAAVTEAVRVARIYSSRSGN